MNGEIDENKIASIEGFRLQRYRFWRTGLYFEGGAFSHYGEKKLNTEDTHLIHARLGIVQGAKIHLTKDIGDELFLRGMGDRDFTYLGWGQPIFVEEGKHEKK
jgi:hypothetical protein